MEVEVTPLDWKQNMGHSDQTEERARCDQVGFHLVGPGVRGGRADRLTDLRLSCERRLMRRKGNLHLVPSNQMQRAHMQFFLSWPRSSASSAC